MIQRRKPKSLDAWLDAATRGLCDDARERIEEEIVAHFEEKFDHARAEGISEVEARSAAVRSLGNPRDARKRWQDEHLTRREARIVSKFVQYDQKHAMRFGSGPNFVWRVSLQSAIAVAMIPIVIKRVLTELFSVTPFLVGIVYFLFVSAPIFFGFTWWFGIYLGRRLHVYESPPIWRVIQLQGFLSISSAAVSLPMMWSYIILPPSYEGMGSMISNLWWLLVVLFHIVLPWVAIETMRTFRFAQKLRRLGYDQPPSAYG